MTDRLDTIRKRLASGSPFGAYGTDLVWAVGEIERLTSENAALRSTIVLNGNEYAFAAHEIDRLRAQLRLVDGARNEMRRELDGVARAEIARLDALLRATADDPEDVVPCVPCGKVECGDARDEMENA